VSRFTRALQTTATTTRLLTRREAKLSMTLTVRRHKSGWQWKKTNGRSSMMMRWSSLALRIWKRKHSVVNSSRSLPKSKVQASPLTCLSTSERKRLKSDRYKKVVGRRSCVSVWNRSPSLCRSGCRSKWLGATWSSLSIVKSSMTTSLRWLSKS